MEALVFTIKHRGFLSFFLTNPMNKGCYGICLHGKETPIGFCVTLILFTTLVVFYSFTFSHYMGYYSTNGMQWAHTGIVAIRGKQSSHPMRM